MKKFDIKWILILVLVVILAFGLVACGNKGGDNNTPEEDDGPVTPKDSTKSTPSEFFGALWESASSLGQEEVDPDKDKVKIDLGMDIAVDSKTLDTGNLDIGVQLQLVADLKAMNTTGNLGDTALKLKAYDKLTDTNWVTMWYFLDTGKEGDIYFQIQDGNKAQYFKVSFETMWNNYFSTLLRGALASDLDFFKNDNGQWNTSIHNILGLINAVAESGGNDWSLDTLIMGKGDFPGVLGLFGLNLSKLLSDESIAGILSGLGIEIDASGNISLGKALQELGDAVLVDCKKVEKDGIKTYSAKVDSGILGIAGGMIGMSDLFSNVDVGLSFNTTADGKEIKGLSLAVGASKATKLNNTQIKINITDFAIKKTSKTSDVDLGTSGKTFSNYVNIDWEGQMDATEWGLQLNPQLDNDNANNIKIGKVNIKLDASIDLTGEKTANKTAAKLVITNDITPDNASDAEKVLTAIYTGNVLTLQTDLTSVNNQKIAIEALYPLAKLIKKAAITDASVPYKIFGDMADDVISGMFEIEDNKVKTVKTNFSTIVITGVDIKTLAKGAFYAIFGGLATGANDEKPQEIKLETYGGYEGDSAYNWKLNIATIVDVVSKAISYNKTTKDYSLKISNIATTIASVFKDKDGKVTFDQPKTVAEMMALFMCTNDGLLLDLTRHGLLPLYKNNAITSDYISGSLTPVEAANAGYNAIPGKMISKADAEAIWAFLTSTSDNPTLKLSFQASAGTYYDVDEDKPNAAAYVANSAIGWFTKFVSGSTVTGDSTAANIVTTLTNNSAIEITLNREDGSMSCDIKLNNKSIKKDNSFIKYNITGTNIAYAVDQIDYASIDDDNKVVVNLNENFYKLFNANFGYGPTTTISLADENYGDNTDLYILATNATYNTDAKVYESITYKGCAIIRAGTATSPVYYLVDAAGMTDVTDYVTVTASSVVIAGVSAEVNGTYNVSAGSAYKVYVQA